MIILSVIQSINFHNNNNDKKKKVPNSIHICAKRCTDAPPVDKIKSRNNNNKLMSCCSDRADVLALV